MDVLVLVGLGALAAVVFTFAGACIAFGMRRRHHEMDRELAQLREEVKTIRRRLDAQMWQERKPVGAPSQATSAIPDPVVPAPATEQTWLEPAKSTESVARDASPARVTDIVAPPSAPTEPQTTPLASILASINTATEAAPDFEADLAAVRATPNKNFSSTPTEKPTPGASSSSAIPPASPTLPNPPNKIAHPTAEKRTLDQWEAIVGRRWMTWVGVLICFIAGAFAVHYGFTHGLIGPWMRLGLGIVSAAGLAAWGQWLITRRLAILGQGLTGLGLMLAYASCFAAYAFPDTRIIGQSAAFVGMIVVTAVGIGLSLWRDTMPVAVLATLGGLLTPILLSTGGGSRDGLFSYLLVLDLGVLAAAALRRWRALDATAFAGTAIIFSLWWMRTGSAGSSLGTALWLVGFWVVFTAISLIYRWRWQAMLPGESYLLAASNAALTLVGLGLALHDQRGWWVATDVFVAVGYLLIAWRAERWFGGDRFARSGYCGFAALAFACAIIAGLRGPALIAAWSGEAAVLWYLARRLRFLPLAVYGSAIGAVAGVVATSAAFTRQNDTWGALLGDLMFPVAAILIARWSSALRGRAWIRALWSMATLTWCLWPVYRLELFFLHQWSWSALSVQMWEVLGVLAAAWMVPVALFPRQPGLAMRRTSQAILGTLLLVATVFTWARLAGTTVAPLGNMGALLGLLGIVALIGFRARWRHPTRQTTFILSIWWVAIALTVECGHGWHLGWSQEFILSARSVVWAVAAIAFAHAGVLRTPATYQVINLGVAGAWMIAAMISGWDTAAVLPPATIAGIIVVLATAVVAYAASGGLRQAAAASASVLMMAVIHADLRRRLPALGDERVGFLQPHQLAGLLWAMCAGIGQVLRARAPWLQWTTLTGLLVAAVTVLGTYALPIPLAYPMCNPAFVTAALVVGVLIREIHLTDPARREAFRWVAVGWAWLAITCEATSAVRVLAVAGHLRLLGMSIGWSLLAIALIAIGFRVSHRGLRLAGLALFALTVAKLALFDLAHLHDLARIGSFLVAGCLLLGGSWLYQRLERRARERQATLVPPEPSMPMPTPPAPEPSTPPA